MDRDGLGRRVYVFRPGRWDPERIPFTDVQYTCDEIQCNRAVQVFCCGYLLSELVAREQVR